MRPTLRRRKVSHAICITNRYHNPDVWIACGSGHVEHSDDITILNNSTPILTRWQHIKCDCISTLPNIIHPAADWEIHSIKCAAIGLGVKSSRLSGQIGNGVESRECIYYACALNCPDCWQRNGFRSHVHAYPSQ